MLIFLGCFNASQRDRLAETMAKFHGTKPVEFEVSVKVTFAADLMKGNGTFRSPNFQVVLNLGSVGILA